MPNCHRCLLKLLRDRSHDAVHVIELDLHQAEDEVISKVATKEEYFLITKDEDFAVRVVADLDHAAVIWVRVGNCSNPALIAWFEPLVEEIVARLMDGERLIEIS